MEGERLRLWGQQETCEPDIQEFDLLSENKRIFGGFGHTKLETRLSEASAEVQYFENSRLRAFHRTESQGATLDVQDQMTIKFCLTSTEHEKHEGFSGANGRERSPSPAVSVTPDCFADVNRSKTLPPRGNF